MILVISGTLHFSSSSFSSCPYNLKFFVTLIIFALFYIITSFFFFFIVHPYVPLILFLGPDCVWYTWAQLWWLCLCIIFLFIQSQNTCQQLHILFLWFSWQGRQKEQSNILFFYLCLFFHYEVPHYASHMISYEISSYLVVQLKIPLIEILYLASMGSLWYKNKSSTNKDKQILNRPF